MIDTRKSDLAKIHIARKDCGMEEKSYRTMLAREGGGKTSAADMSAAERAAVLIWFGKIGWHSRRGGTPKHGAPAQRAKIKALLRAAGKPDGYAEGIAKQMFSRPIGHCSPEQLRGIITALIAQGKRNDNRRTN